MLSVRVRTLTGAEALVELPESATVADLRADLRRREGFGRGAGSLALFVGGRRLADGGARLATLLGPAGGGGAFVVSLSLFFSPSEAPEASPFFMASCSAHTWPPTF